MRPRRPIVLALVLLVPLATGCGGGGSPSPATTATARRAAPAAHPTALLFRADPTSPAAIARTVAVLRRRLADRGLAGATVERSGSERIAVALPDRRTADRVKFGLSAQGRLAIYDWERDVLGADGRPHPGDDDVTGGTIAGQPGAGTMSRAAAVRLAAAHHGVPVRATADPEDKAATGLAADAYFVLADRPALRGSDLVDPAQDVDEAGGEPTVTFSFSAAGAARWRALTRTVARRGARHVSPGRPPQQAAQHFAIVLDDRLLSVPYVDPQQNPDGISPDDGAQISGGLTRASARDLAALLKSGPLPVTLHLLGERQR